MARAKRIDRNRAEARRRYRASLAAQAPDATSPDEAGGEAAGDRPATGADQHRAATRASSGRGTSPQGRLSLGQAFRAAFRPANIREDVRALPGLLTHKAVWIPLALSALSVFGFSLTGPQNPVTLFAFNTFGLPPALAAIFIAGFFVPRAAYLAGGIVATVATIFYAIFVVLAAQGLVPDVPAVAAERVPAEILSALSIGPVSGVLFGAAAAWYRRFLSLTSPARVNRAGGQGRRSGGGGGRRQSGR